MNSMSDHREDGFISAVVTDNWWSAVWMIFEEACGTCMSEMPRYKLIVVYNLKSTPTPGFNEEIYNHESDTMRFCL